MLSLHQKKRRSLLKHMDQLEQNAIHCLGCSGQCCTIAHNSMMISPGEALEIISDAITKHSLNKLLEHCIASIEKFQLNRPLPGTGHHQVRRYYTCPFFQKQRCTVSKSVKPFGCLKFNPSAAHENTGRSCKISKIEFEHEKDLAKHDEKIAHSLKLYWAKETIPVAITETIDALKKQGIHQTDIEPSHALEMIVKKGLEKVLSLSQNI